MIYRTAPFSTTFNDPYPRFQGHAIIWCWISQKRYEIHSFSGTGTYTHHTEGCHFEWPRVTLGDLAKYLVTRNVERSLCNSWASCRQWIYRFVLLRITTAVKTDNDDDDGGDDDDDNSSISNNNKSTQRAQTPPKPLHWRPVVPKCHIKCRICYGAVTPWRFSQRMPDVWKFGEYAGIRWTFDKIFQFWAYTQRIYNVSDVYITY